MRKHGFLGVLRRCFSEVIDWGWMERRFTPQRVFATPRHLKHQMRVDPRTISDDLWAKLLWAGLNLRAEDCPLRGHHRTRRWAKKAGKQPPNPLVGEAISAWEAVRPAQPELVVPPKRVNASSSCSAAGPSASLKPT